MALIVACAACSTDGAPKDTRPSILLIVVDTLRADHLGAYGYQRPTSPHLDAFAERALVYEQAQATSSWTLPSMASLFSGQLPSRHTAGCERDEKGRIKKANGDKVYNVLPPSVLTIAEVLRAAGYDTAAFVTNSFLTSLFGLGQGFDVYEHFGEKPAEKVVDALLAWTDATSDSPFFVWAHFFDPHLPYNAEGEFAGRFTSGIESAYSLPVHDLFDIRTNADTLTEDDWAFIKAAYDEEIASFDAQFARLMDGLEKQGRLDSTIVIVTSDHGEEFYDHGGYEHGHAMYQELLHVPLMLAGPGIPAGRVSSPVSLIDVVPTLAALGRTKAPGPLLGRSLLETAARQARALRGKPSAEGVRDRLLISEGNLYRSALRSNVHWPYKVIEGRTKAVFNLAEDPGETRPLQDDELADRLRHEMQERLEVAKDLAAQGMAADIDEETLARLRALGYLDG